MGTCVDIHMCVHMHTCICSQTHSSYTRALPCSTDVHNFQALVTSSLPTQVWGKRIRVLTPESYCHMIHTQFAKHCQNKLTTPKPPASDLQEATCSSGVPLSSVHTGLQTPTQASRRHSIRSFAVVFVHLFPFVPI